MKKKVIFASILLVAGCTIPLLLLEVLLWFAPVTSNIEFSFVTKASPYLHHPPHAEVLTSLGWNFYSVIHTRANNYGYISHMDYFQNAKPILAVIGDSFVEALQVDKDRNLTAALNGSGMGLVYSVATSGAALAQYLAFVKFAELEFNPRAFVIVIIGNDFDESLCAVRPQPGHYCYDRVNGKLTLTLKDSYPISGLRKLAKRSALLRYLVFNLQVDWRRLVTAAHLLGEEVTDTRYVGNTEFSKSLMIEEESRNVVDQFFEDLGNIVKSKPVLFVVDADRESVYRGLPREDAYFSKMRKYFIHRAQSHHHEAVDMYPIFLDHYRLHGAKFEHATDAHWNELGHRLAADAVLHSTTVQRLTLSAENVR